jgi:hypothetical protein
MRRARRVARARCVSGCRVWRAAARWFVPVGVGCSAALRECAVGVSDPLRASAHACVLWRCWCRRGRRMDTVAAARAAPSTLEVRFRRACV